MEKDHHVFASISHKLAGVILLLFVCAHAICSQQQDYTQTASDTSPLLAPNKTAKPATINIVRIDEDVWITKKEITAVRSLFKKNSETVMVPGNEKYRAVASTNRRDWYKIIYNNRPVWIESKFLQILPHNKDFYKKPYEPDLNDIYQIDKIRDPYPLSDATRLKDLLPPPPRSGEYFLSTFPALADGIDTQIINAMFSIGYKVVENPEEKEIQEKYANFDGALFEFRMVMQYYPYITGGFGFTASYLIYLIDTQTPFQFYPTISFRFLKEMLKDSNGYYILDPQGKGIKAWGYDLEPGFGLMLGFGEYFFLRSEITVSLDRLVLKHEFLKAFLATLGMGIKF